MGTTMAVASWFQRSSTSKTRCCCAFAQVPAPQYSGGDGAVRSPPCSARNSLFVRERPFDAEHPRERFLQCEVARRPDVRPPERHELVNAGSPRAHPVTRDEFPLSVLVGRARQVSEHEIAAFDSLGEREQVSRFLARHAASHQSRRACASDRRGRPAAWQLLRQSPVQRARGRERHLLLEDDSRERRETGPACPQWRYTVSADDLLERTVAAREVRDRARQRAARQSEL